MNSKEALKLTILEYEKDLEFDENNQWVKNVLKGLKECQKDLDRLEKLEKTFEILKKSLLLSVVEIRGYYYVCAHDNNYFMKKEEADLIKEVIEDE